MPRQATAIRHVMWDGKMLTSECNIFVNPFPIQVLFVIELLGWHSGLDVFSLPPDKQKYFRLVKKELNPGLSLFLVAPTTAGINKREELAANNALILKWFLFASCVLQF